MSSWPSINIYTDNHGKTYVDGYLYMGRPRTPPLPPHVIMKDRTNGETYLLSHEGDPGSLTLDLTITLPRNPESATLGAFSGPIVLGGWRLYIDGGVLMAEVVTDNPGERKVFTRKAYERTFLEINVSPTGAIETSEISV